MEVILYTWLVCFEQHQAVRRHTTAWAETLRYRKAEFEAMGGLRRITLNENILIGDRGVTSLAQELTEDLWVKGQRTCTVRSTIQINMACLVLK